MSTGQIAPSRHGCGKRQFQKQEKYLLFILAKKDIHELKYAYLFL